MLSCHNCMRHCLQSVIGQPLQRTQIRSIPSPHSTYRNLTRLYSTSQTTSQKRKESIQPNSNGFTIRRTSPNDRSALGGTEEIRQKWLQSRGSRPVGQRKRKPNFDTEENMKRHMQFLQDPLKLADYIRTTLRNDDFETAEKVVHYASKTMLCVVSWNHLVDWQMSKGKMSAAIKTYNDVCILSLAYISSRIDSS